MKELEAKQALWRKYGMDDHQLLDREGLRKLVNSDAYCGGMLDTTGGHMHPLNLVLGEARAFEGIGGTIYEQSPVTRVDHEAARPVVYAEGGEVRRASSCSAAMHISVTQCRSSSHASCRSRRR